MIHFSEKELFRSYMEDYECCEDCLVWFLCFNLRCRFSDTIDPYNFLQCWHYFISDVLYVVCLLHLICDGYVCVLLLHGSIKLSLLSIVHRLVVSVLAARWLGVGLSGCSALFLRVVLGARVMVVCFWGKYYFLKSFFKYYIGIKAVRSAVCFCGVVCISKGKGFKVVVPEGGADGESYL